MSSATAQARVRGSAGAAQLGGQVETEPLGVHERPERLLEALRHAHLAGRRVEHRRVAVSVRERVRERAAGQPVNLAEDAARGLLVHLRVGLAAQQILAVQHLEQIELEVPEVALVVTHGRPRLGRECAAADVLPVSNKSIVPASNLDGEAGVGCPRGGRAAARPGGRRPGGAPGGPAGRGGARDGQLGRIGTGQPGRMLTARAMTRAARPSETADWTSMVSLAQRASGITSVGLNAVALVNDRYR